MAKMVLWRLIFLAFIIWGSIITISFVLERNRINQNHPSSQASSNEKTAEPKKKSENKKFVPEDIEFSKNFFFGTAYSDFQTTGISETSDWYAYINNLKPPLIGPGVGNDFLNRYKEDFDLAGQIGIQVHRMSLEWSRFEPEEGKWDMEMVKKYKTIFAYMKKRGVEPMICLNHFPLPKWFADIGGWENPRAPELYGRYAEFIAKNIGVPLKIKWWLTFNEPQFMVLIPYGKGGWPPFKTVEGFKDTEGIDRFFLVGSRILDSHRTAYRAIHKVMDSHKQKPMVGFASATGAFYPADPDSPTDRMASNAYNVFYGTLMDYSVGSVDRDFVGINYYGRTKLKLHISFWNQVKSWLNPDRPFDIEWVSERSNRPDTQPKKFHPLALYDLIMKFKVLGKPIIITENGLDDDADKFREEFIVLHLKAIHDAIRDGANVIGYQYWALADTWEPGDDNFSQMGLIKIDRDDNLTRSLRPSAWTYAEIIKTHKITKELLEKYKELVP